MKTDIERYDTAQVYMSSPSGEPSNNETGIIVGAVVGAVVFVFIIVACACRTKKRRSRLIRKRVNKVTRVDGQVYVVPMRDNVRTVEDVARRYERSVSTLSTKSQVYLVPFDALPPNFDFSSRDVDVKADYVVLKDLAILEKSAPSAPPSGVINQAYESEESYYSNYRNNINSYLEGELNKKQPPYNPNFY